MLRSEYLRSLGSLVESVLQRILNEIKEQVDIEESDSKQLNTICKSLHSLIDLFNLQPDFDPVSHSPPSPRWWLLPRLLMLMVDFVGRYLSLPS